MLIRGGKKFLVAHQTLSGRTSLCDSKDKVPDHCVILPLKNRGSNIKNI